MGGIDWGQLWLARERRGRVTIDPKLDPVLKMLEYFAPNSHGTILEVGAGTGLRTMHFAKRHRLKAAYLDLSVDVLGLIARREQEIRFRGRKVQGDARHMPFESGSFDIVWSADLCEHFVGPERQTVFDEMVRVCKKGGRVIVIVPNSYNIPYCLTKAFKSLFGGWPYGIEKPFTPAELVARMRAAGLRNVKMYGIGALLAHYRWFFHDTSLAGKLLRNPTGIPLLNRVLIRADLAMGPNKHFNNFFGREIGAVGIK